MNPTPKDPPTEPGARPPWAAVVDGPTVDRYVLGPELGRGGMGRVHAAWDPLLKRVVALKLLLGHDPDLHLRLLREARTQARLDHPGICRIHDLGQAEGHPYIAMQLVQGRSLADLRPELDFRAMAALLADVAAAVHAAHQAGLIHRDLKPANILVESHPDGTRRPCVVDFGLARDLTLLDQTLSWAVMGTPAFMSPEQTLGEALGPATDIYSLGATLYALISGHPPYEGTTLAGLITNQSDAGVRAVRRLNPDVPRDLETITLKCLEREPTQRYATARALEEDLRRFLAGEPILARPVGPLGRLWRWAQRRPSLAATAAAGLLVALVLLGWNSHIRTTARLREQATQHFALEIRDAEHLLRIERMLPIHDIRPAEARLRARMEAIQQDMTRLGQPAQGPGHYALGRGHLALKEYAKALEDLDAAWNAGFQSPEVAYGIGLARLKEYQRRKALWHERHLSAPELAADAKDLVEPALRWMDHAKDARVDHPDYGAALVAQAQNRFAEADRLFQQALEQAPWLYEAWQGRSASQLDGYGQPGREVDFAEASRVVTLGESYLASAIALAPSDDELRVDRAHALLSQSINTSARRSRSEVPLQRAAQCLEEALIIRPDAQRVRLSLATVALQSGFLMLSTGGDPGPLMRREAARLAPWDDRAAWKLESDWRSLLGTRHHLWWVAAEADLRFGRDPRPALAQARRARKEVPPDIHHAFSLLIEAQALAARGQDPTPVHREIEALFQAVDAYTDSPTNPFIHSTKGQAFFEMARWQRETGLGGEASMRVAQRELERAQSLDGTFAYTYYHLPRLHALKARMALAGGEDPTPHITAALAAAKRGVAINPGNAHLQLAAADAHLAAGQVKVHLGENPTSAWAACRAALAAGERANPRDYQMALLRAELECAMAETAGDRDLHLRAAEEACRAGLALKRDEPRLRKLLGRKPGKD